MPYPYLPPAEMLPVNRTVVPNRFYDPDTGYQLYKNYYDIYSAADSLGLDIMVNEHHSTATCTNSVVPLSMAIIARETSSARILALGNPLSNRRDPVRIAEEMATVDVISQGRAEVGFVRGVPMEHSATNSSPVDTKERFWEAADLIVKAWTTHDGPFSWEGEYFHHRQVNIWPRPYQQPHPPVWVPTLSAQSAGELAARGFNVATLGNGTQQCGLIFDAYRSKCEELNLASPRPEQFGYSPFVFVGDTDERAKQEVEKIRRWVIELLRTPKQFSDVPGLVDARARAQSVSGQGSVGKSEPSHADRPLSLYEMAYAPIDELIRLGYVMAGNPDTVFEQLKSFHDSVGGFGNLLAMMQYSTMSVESVHQSMERLANDVLPRFNSEVFEPSARGDREMVSAN
jgi:alkanesulfonate monooxygenase SsuD/methylene tetrahydromethanopterin reductase-like flavin-dependent oxidoreductase (luciferase family)